MDLSANRTQTSTMDLSANRTQTSTMEIKTYLVHDGIVGPTCQSLHSLRQEKIVQSISRGEAGISRGEAGISRDEAGHARRISSDQSGSAGASGGASAGALVGELLGFQ
jgi:hypothetical protein